MHTRRLARFLGLCSLWDGMVGRRPGWTRPGAVVGKSASGLFNAWGQEATGAADHLIDMYALHYLRHTPL